MTDPSDIERIRNEVRHGFQYVLPRTALNDVEVLLKHYDAEKLRRERYQATLQKLFTWARENDVYELLEIMGLSPEDIDAK